MQLGGALWNGLQFHFYVFMAHYSASKQIHAKGHGAKKRYNDFDVVEWQETIVE